MVKVMKCNSRILFILLLIVMIFSITAVSAAENHTQVKNVADHESVNNMDLLEPGYNFDVINKKEKKMIIVLYWIRKGKKICSLF